MQNKNKTLLVFMSSTAGIVAIAAILLIIGYIFKDTNIRIDCTKDSIYTLSTATKDVLGNLDRKLTIRFYYSKDVAQMPVSLKSYAKRIDDILREYEIYGQGKIKLERLNPKPDTDTEDSAELDGINGQAGSALGIEDNIYLGIAIRSGDQLVSMPFLSPDRENLLEYDLTRAIVSVTHPVKHKLGVISALKLFGGIDNPTMMMQGRGGMKPAWLIITELKKEYNIAEIPMTAESIPDDIDILLVVHPKDASERLQFAIDQFVLRGGKLIAFLDPISLADMQSQPRDQMQYMAPNASSTLDKLLPAWGINFDIDQIVIDRTCATPIQTQQNSQPSIEPSILSLTEANIGEDPATAQMSSILLLNAGAFTGTPAEGLTKTVLLSSTKDSQFLEKYATQRKSDDILRDFEADNTEKELLIRLTGTFKTAFPDGAPWRDKNTQDDSSLKASTIPGLVVLVADTDLMYDPFCVQKNSLFGQSYYQPINNNLALVENLIETAGGDTALFQIRSRGVREYPFIKVRDMEKTASEKFKDEIKKFEEDVQNFQVELYSLQQTRNAGDKELLSKEQKDAVKKIRKKEAEARKNLKKVRKDMRKDIEALENKIMIINIALMPLLVIIGGIILAIYKRIRTSAK